MKKGWRRVRDVNDSVLSEFVLLQEAIAITAIQLSCLLSHAISPAYIHQIHMHSVCQIVLCPVRLWHLPAWLPVCDSPAGCLSVDSSVNWFTISIHAKSFLLQWGSHTTRYNLEENKYKSLLPFRNMAKMAIFLLCHWAKMGLRTGNQEAFHFTAEHLSHISSNQVIGNQYFILGEIFSLKSTSTLWSPCAVAQLPKKIVPPNFGCMTASC